MVVRHPVLVSQARKRADERRRYVERLKSRPEAFARYKERQRSSSAAAAAKRDPEQLRQAARERMRRLRSSPEKRDEINRRAKAKRLDPSNADRYAQQLARRREKERARRQSDPEYRARQNAKERERRRKRRLCDVTRERLNKSQRERARRRYAEDPEYRATVLRKKLERARQNPDRYLAQRRRYRRKRSTKTMQSLRRIVYRVVKQGQKSFRSSRYLGIELFGAKEWIESMLCDGWTWENHGKLWHIDHIFPIAQANLEDPVEVMAVSNYKNLRPISVAENKSKKDKVTPEAAALFEELKQESLVSMAAGQSARQDARR